LQEANRLSPLGVYVPFKTFGFYLACFVDGNYEGVLDGTAKALREHPGDITALRYRTAALALLGRLDEARRTVDQLLVANPEVTISRARRHIEVEMNNPFKRAGVAEAYYEGLQRTLIPLSQVRPYLVAPLPPRDDFG
jgi:hypothetical protein